MAKDFGIGSGYEHLQQEHDAIVALHAPPDLDVHHSIAFDATPPELAVLLDLLFEYDIPTGTRDDALLCMAVTPTKFSGWLDTLLELGEHDPRVGPVVAMWAHGRKP